MNRSFFVQITLKIYKHGVFESKYADLFPNDTGNVAKPLRTALGSLIIQKKLGFSDRELVEQITENPYLQYFIGLPGYQEEPPFDASTLVREPLQNADEDSLYLVESLKRLPRRGFGEVDNSGLISRH